MTVADVSAELPEGTPQEIRDFFSCHTDRLVWRPGEMGWLAGGSSADVSFASGADPGTISVDVSAAHGFVKFSITLSVNEAGALVIDRSSIPELPGRAGASGLDAAVAQVNDWFRQNGKQLKPLALQDGALVLEKIPSPDTAAPPPAPDTATQSAVPGGLLQDHPVVSQKSGRGCALVATLLVGIMGAALPGIVRLVWR